MPCFEGGTVGLELSESPADGGYNVTPMMQYISHSFTILMEDPVSLIVETLGFPRGQHLLGPGFESPQHSSLAL